MHPDRLCPACAADAAAAAVSTHTVAYTSSYSPTDACPADPEANSSPYADAADAPTADARSFSGAHAAPADTR